MEPMEKSFKLTRMMLSWIRVGEIDYNQAPEQAEQLRRVLVCLSWQCSSSIYMPPIDSRPDARVGLKRRFLHFWDECEMESWLASSTARRPEDKQKKRNQLTRYSPYSKSNEKYAFRRFWSSHKLLRYSRNIGLLRGYAWTTTNLRPLQSRSICSIPWRMNQIQLLILIYMNVLVCIKPANSK